MHYVAAIVIMKKERKILFVKILILKFGYFMWGGGNPKLFVKLTELENLQKQESTKYKKKKNMISEVFFGSVPTLPSPSQ